MKKEEDWPTMITTKHQLAPDEVNTAVQVLIEGVHWLKKDVFDSSMITDLFDGTCDEDKANWISLVKSSALGL